MDDTVRYVSDKNVTDVIGLFKTAIDMASSVFGMDPIAIAGCLGRATGQFVSCEDDLMKNNAELMKMFHAAADKHGVTIKKMPCIDTFQLNFDDAHTRHQKLHDTIRADLNMANDMLAKVCESNRRRG